MVPASDSHSAVRETLMLVRQQLRLQANAVQALSSQLDEAKSQLDFLEMLNASLVQFLPDQAGKDSAAPATQAMHTVTSEAVRQAASHEPAASVAPGVELTDFRASKPFSIQEMILNVLSTARGSLRARDLVTIIERLRAEGRTDLLRDSKRPDSVVSSALDRLCKKGLVRKVGRGQYTLS
ncbi:hypothetical protein KQH42_21005 [Streptomyces sp. CHA1]|nr:MULTISPECIES: hypothetical protein [unclassified Streptomyces]MCO6709254.1 hypothetical protein [Streptomyces sp. CHA3]MCO6744738.1 hypothetical protein [Streptomyces sp. CHA1]UUD70002.1 hypothetical protein KNZ81_21530 [Streptomyces sp. G11C(2021)]